MKAWERKQMRGVKEHRLEWKGLKWEVEVVVVVAAVEMMMIDGDVEQTSSELESLYETCEGKR